MSDKKITLISGASGQDASILSRDLLSRGEKVVAFERHTQEKTHGNISDILENPNYILESGDVTDFSSVSRLIAIYKPNKFFNLAANSFVGSSWNSPIAVFQTNALGVLYGLEAIRTINPTTRFLQASTSECVGNSKEKIQNEDTILTPRSPYGASKAAAEHLVKVYRESYNLFACYTRCYNHTSIVRGKEFVERKITNYIGETFHKVEKEVLSKPRCNSFISVQDAFEQALSLGVIKPLALGNLSTSRDFVSSYDCVRAMDMILESEKPDDFVVASGVEYTLSEILTIAFKKVGVLDWSKFVVEDPKFYRPNDVTTLRGDATKIKKALGWSQTIEFEELIGQMVDNDIKIHRGE